MKTQILILLLAINASIAQTDTNVIATHVTLTNAAGRVYTNIDLLRTNKLGFVWQAQDGSMGQLKYVDLPADVRAAYNVPQSHVRAAVVAEAKANDFWRRKAEYDAYWGPIYAEGTMQAVYTAQERVAATERAIDEAGQRASNRAWMRRWYGNWCNYP